MGEFTNWLEQNPNKRGKYVMPIKYVIVPEPVTLVEPVTKARLKVEGEVVPPVTIQIFLSKQWFDPLWAESYRYIKTAATIDKAFDGKVPGDAVPVAQEDWERVCKNLRGEADDERKKAEPQKRPAHQYGYHSAVMPQLCCFIDAFLDAKDAPPAEAK